MDRIMVVEDDETLADNIRIYLERNGWEVGVYHSVETAMADLESVRPDVILADYMLPGETGLELLEGARVTDPQIKVVMVTGHGDIQLAVDAMKAGAFDYASKPLVLAELKLLLERALVASRAEKTLTFYRNNQARGSGMKAMIGDSPAMSRIKETINQIVEMEHRVVDGMLPAVLITGETGTGKELVARALHFDGLRRDGPFVEVNCASLPVNLLESELFGHERGAFTDAKERKVGLVEAAEGGTLFLDEIGEVDLSIQAKLLKLLEERTVRRVGSTRERKVDVRIVSATNQDLEKMVREGRFRSDLYFRLRIISLHMPPLRDRRQDVLPLASHFLALHGNRYGKRNLELSPEAQRLLLEHSWPGNVRELKNCAEQAVLLARDSHVHPDTMALRTFHQEGDAATAGGPAASAGEGPARGGHLNRARVEAVIEETNWNVARAARVLGISRDTLRYRMRKYGLSAGMRAAGAAPDAGEDEMSDGKVASAGGNGRQR